MGLTVNVLGVKSNLMDFGSYMMIIQKTNTYRLKNAFYMYVIPYK